VAPTSTIPLPFFVESLTRLGASGVLPAAWARAAVAATRAAEAAAPAEEAAASGRERAPAAASSSSSSSPLHAIGELFRVTTAAEGTAAAAALTSGDAEAGE
jgi:hypothetical protein